MRLRLGQAELNNLHAEFRRGEWGASVIYHGLLSSVIIDNFNIKHRRQSSRVGWVEQRETHRTDD
jgi:hypothetical protein